MIVKYRIFRMSTTRTTHSIPYRCTRYTHTYTVLVIMIGVILTRLSRIPGGTVPVRH